MEFLNDPTDKVYRVLSPGRIYFEYGPVAMLIWAEHQGRGLTDLGIESLAVVESSLREIADSRPLLRLFQQFIDRDKLTGLPRRMFEAVAAVGEQTLTPMAAVAGTMADAVADWLWLNGASRVVVNNGGDIALRLAPEETVEVGLVSQLASGRVDYTVSISGASGIGGMATSGLGGRSFTRGIAQGVSALARRCDLADALATHLVNSSRLDSEKVVTTLAGQLDPDSDIKDLSVVLAVDRLSDEEVRQALGQIKREAEKQRAAGNLMALSARVQDEFYLMDMAELIRAGR